MPCVLLQHKRDSGRQDQQCLLSSRHLACLILPVSPKMAEEFSAALSAIIPKHLVLNSSIAVLLPGFQAPSSLQENLSCQQRAEPAGHHKRSEDPGYTQKGFLRIKEVSRDSLKRPAPFEADNPCLLRYSSTTTRRSRKTLMSPTYLHGNPSLTCSTTLVKSSRQANSKRLLLKLGRRAHCSHSKSPSALGVYIWERLADWLHMALWGGLRTITRSRPCKPTVAYPYCD